MRGHYPLAGPVPATDRPRSASSANGRTESIELARGCAHRTCTPGAASGFGPFRAPPRTIRRHWFDTSLGPEVEATA
jgi:hypothetical protein